MLEPQDYGHMSRRDREMMDRLRRRALFLKARTATDPRELHWDNAELSALEWAMQQIAGSRAEAMAAALQQLAECDLHDGNCTSLEVASNRIRNIARAALVEP